MEFYRHDDSRDLDQLTVAQSRSDGAVVTRPSALDDHALRNTTSVYTVAETFSMLPEKLSTDLTSLNQDSDRLAMVVEIVFGGDGALRSSDIYRTTVRNRARLSDDAVSHWL